jgi:hypothetical protein
MDTLKAPREETGDLVLHESVTGLPGHAPLALFVVSLYGLQRSTGETISGDALMVRPRGTDDLDFLASVLGCAPEDLPGLLTKAGSWSIREVSEIDGHRIRVDPN